MEILGRDISIARILHESDEFITLEVAKTNDTKFTLDQDAEGNVIGGDKFLTLIFVHKSSTDGAAMEIWKPWEE